MKCPHCSSSVSRLARAMNTFKDKKECPHCGGLVRLWPNWIRPVVWFLPVYFLGGLLEQLALHAGWDPDYASIPRSLLIALLVAVSFELQAVHPDA